MAVQDHPDWALARGWERPAARRPLLIAGAVCGTVGVLAWVFYVWVFHGDPGQDWMVFYTAARAYLDGNLPLIFDGEALTAALNQRFAGWLAFPLNLHPWVYPPPFLLLFLPFGLLPPAASYGLFLLVGFALAAAAAWRYAEEPVERGILLFSLLLCPATPFTVMTGQNAFLTAAVFLGGFGLLGRRPFAAGLVLGVLSLKPQFALMAPVALLAAREWRALVGAAVSAIGLALASLAVFGIEAWREWFQLASGATEIYRAWAAAGRINGLSVFACARLLGGSETIANLAQATAILVAAGGTWVAFRRPLAGRLRLAAVLAATMLAAPHASASDAVLLGLAAGLLFAGAIAGECRLAPAAIAVAVWICPLLNPPSLFRAGLTTPVLLLLFLASILAVEATVKPSLTTARQTGGE